LLATLIGLGVSRGMTIVAAVDQGHPDHSFPSSVTGVLPVADERLSLRGAGVYIAPGRDIPTTEPEGKWSLVSGSSYAAAHVSGLAALLRQLSPGRGAGLSATAAMGPRGLIDACAAVARVSALDAQACRLRD
jgi:subtilisin family serine protease